MVRRRFRVGAGAAAVLSVGMWSSALAAPPSTDALVAALPGALDWPPGWSSVGGEPETEFVREAGDGIGLCGGINENARAWEAGVFAYAGSPAVFADDQATFAGVRLYSFPDATKATEFMNTTAAQAEACEVDREYTLPESQFDRYLDVESATWEIRETVSLGAAAVPDADDAYFYRIDTEFQDAGAAVPTGGRDVTLVQMEQYGVLVISVVVGGSCCQYGFSNAEVLAEGELADYAVLQLAAGAVRPGILEALAI